LASRVTEDEAANAKTILAERKRRKGERKQQVLQAAPVEHPDFSEHYARAREAQRQASIKIAPANASKPVLSLPAFRRPVPSGRRMATPPVLAACSASS
jgi:hypothetical protein